MRVIFSIPASVVTWVRDFMLTTFVPKAVVSYPFEMTFFLPMGSSGPQRNIGNKQNIVANPTKFCFS
jgi:hypothetical protein